MIKVIKYGKLRIGLEKITFTDFIFEYDKNDFNIGDVILDVIQNHPECLEL